MMIRSPMIESEELETLHREYRNMEANRKAYAEESAAVLKKQQLTLDKLRKENDSMKTDISLLQARTTLKPINMNEQKHIAQLIKDVEQYRALISTEKNTIARAEEQAVKYREDIWRLRKETGGSFASSENQRAAEKSVRMLLNKLDQALVKFNKSLAQNRKLRQEIDDLRGERVSFERVYSKLEKSMEERKKQMAQIIEQSNNAYEQRDKACLEMAAIAQADKKEQDQFDQQMSQLGEELEAEIKLALEKRKKNHFHADANEEEAKVIASEKKASRAHTGLKDKDWAAMEQTRVAHKKFEESFRKIYAATGLSDVDIIIETYATNEKKNFSLLKYANEQANEIDKLNEEIRNIREEENMHATDCRSGSAKFDALVKEMEEKIQENQKQLYSAEAKNSEVLHTIESLADGIKMLMNRLNFHDEEIKDVAIGESNILQHLSIIELKLNEMISTHRAYTKSDTIHVERSDSDRVTFGPDAPMTSDRNMYINPPRFTDYSSDENSGDDGCGHSLHPLTYEEIKAKTMSRIVVQGQRRRSTKAIPRRGSTRYGRDSSPSMSRRGSKLYDRLDKNL